LCARCVRPSFIRAMRALLSVGLIQSLFEAFFLRFRSSLAACSRVGVLDRLRLDDAPATIRLLAMRPTRESCWRLRAQ
jgi:hypothetical protein